MHAVSDVSFALTTGETLGLVGETGSGQVDAGARDAPGAARRSRARSGCAGPSSSGSSGRRLTEARRQVQMVFQDPFGSLDPQVARDASWSRSRWSRSRSAPRAERPRAWREVLDLVGLDPARYSARRPRELSGGQAQRVAIARALALDPALIICDEAVSSLDVLIRAQVLNLLERLRTELGLAYLFIAHDLSLVKQVSDRVAVMYLGKLVEIGPAEALYREPLHPYTVALLASIPSPDPTCRSEPVGRDDPGRAAVADRPAQRLPLPHPLPARPGRLRRARSRRCASCADGHFAACHFPVDRRRVPELDGGDRRCSLT